MRARSQRIWLIAVAGLLLAGATALSLTALKDTVAYFAAPSELIAKNKTQPGARARVGGLVEPGSVVRSDGALITFRITDGGATIPVSFDKLLPDLFEEGQGVVAEGRFDAGGQLVADRVLAKHDETYMPREVYESMRDNAPDGAAAYMPRTTTPDSSATQSP